MGDFMKNTVREWLGISEEEFDKIKGQGKCVKCGKETPHPTNNLCIGHERAYHRWLKNREAIEILDKGFIIHCNKMETNRTYFFDYQGRKLKATKWEDGDIEIFEVQA